VAHFVARPIPATPVRAPGQCTGVARPTRNSGPRRKDPRTRRDMQKSPRLPIKWTRSHFNYFPLSLMFSLTPPACFEFTSHSPWPELNRGRGISDQMPVSTDLLGLNQHLPNTLRVKRHRSRYHTLKTMQRVGVAMHRSGVWPRQH